MMTLKNHWARRLVSAAALTIVLPLCARAQAQSATELRTQAEQSGFKEYTSYDNMMKYLQDVQSRSLEMRLGTYGETHVGRQLPYAVFSRPAVSQPFEAWALGKPVLVFAAGVHGGERTLRESVLIYARELSDRTSAHNKLLDEFVIILVPQINPDGFSAQPNATRGNTWGIDLNRDYMKLEQPEIAGFVQNILLKWMPYLSIDGHNGGSFPYNLNYQCASHNAPDPSISRLCDTQIFPAVNRKLEAEKYRAWYYQRGNAEQWNVGGSEPRISRNYAAFANSVGILFESPGQPMETGVKSGLLGYKAVAEWAQANRQTLVDTVNRARRDTILKGEKPGDSVPLAVRYEAEDKPVDYLIGEGQGENRKIVEVKGAKLMKKPVTTLERPRPFAYVLPRDASDAVKLLRQHNITVEQLASPTELTVSAYTVDDVTHSAQYNHAAATTIKVGEVRTIQRTFPAGSYVIRTAQMQGRVAVHLLEPETTDGIVYWNRMDAWIPRPRSTAATTTDEDDDPPAGGRGAGRGAAAGAGGAGRGGAAGRGGQPQQPQVPLVPIFKVMTPTTMPLRIVP